MDIDLSLRGDAFPIEEFARLRGAGPIFWSEILGGWVASSYDDVKTILSDAKAFTNEGTPVAESFAAEAMLVNDSPLHHKIRAVWAKPTAMPAAAQMEGQMSVIVDRLLNDARRDLDAGKPVDLVRLFEGFTSEVITVLMDIPRDQSGNFQRWNRIITDSAAQALENASRDGAAQAAKDEVYTFLKQEIAKRRASLTAGEQPTDLVSLMVASEGRDGITESIALDNLVNLFLGALDTTVRWLGNIVVTLLRDPALMAQIRADRSLLPKLAEEVMRLETVVQLTMRIVKNDGKEIQGQELKAGDHIYVMPGVANRDGDAFDNPDQFNLQRKAKLHMGFGFGMHQCLGMNIARKEVQVFVGRMLDLLPPLRIIRCNYGPSWSIWGPMNLVVAAASKPSEVPVK